MYVLGARANAVGGPGPPGVPLVLFEATGPTRRGEPREASAPLRFPSHVPHLFPSRSTTRRCSWRPKAAGVSVEGTAALVALVPPFRRISPPTSGTPSGLHPPPPGSLLFLHCFLHFLLHASHPTVVLHSLPRFSSWLPKHQCCKSA